MQRRSLKSRRRSNQGLSKVVSRGYCYPPLGRAADEQNRRRLASVIGRLPIPGARRVGGAHGKFHGRLQDSGIDTLTTIETKREEARAAAGLAGSVIRGGSASGDRRGSRLRSLDPTGSNSFRQAELLFENASASRGGGASPRAMP